MKTFTRHIECEFYPDAHEVAEAFWSMGAEEQCAFFQHLNEISGSHLEMQLQYVIDSEFFNEKVKKVMTLIGDYSNVEKD